MTFHDAAQDRQIDFNLKLSSDERNTCFGLNDHATNVFPTTSTIYPCEDGLVAKVFRAEQSRMSKPNALKVFEIAEENDNVKGQVPDMVCYKVFRGTSTHPIRKHLGLSTNVSSVLYVIISRKLRPITELYGDTFLHTWWETVKCHYALWKNDVRHRDISPSSLMYRVVNGKIVGVLNDFDLATIGDGVTGKERTGTVPFMALQLLTKRGLKGEVKHLYKHDAESFIWVLNWITLQYDKGVSHRRNREMDEWPRIDVINCASARSWFLVSAAWNDYKCGEGHERNFEVMKAYMKVLAFHVVSHQNLEVDEAFETLLKGPAEPFLSPRN